MFFATRSSRSSGVLAAGLWVCGAVCFSFKTRTLYLPALVICGGALFRSALVDSNSLAYGCLHPVILRLQRGYRSQPVDQRDHPSSCLPGLPPAQR